MPDDAQLILLQLILLRAARAFLDPELAKGKMNREGALTVLSLLLQWLHTAPKNSQGFAAGACATAGLGAASKN